MKKIIFLILIIFSFNTSVNATSVENNVSSIQDELSINNEVNINLDINKDELKVSRKILDLIKGTNKSLIYNIYIDDILLYKYFFDGSKFGDSYNDIDLTLIFNKNEYIEEIFNTQKIIYFNNKYNGYFPSGTKVYVKNKYFKENLNIYLYLLNSDGSIDLIERKLSVKNDYIEFNIGRGSYYILSDKKHESGIVNILIIIAIIIVFIEMIVVIYRLVKVKKNVELPRLKNKL